MLEDLFLSIAYVTVVSVAEQFTGNRLSRRRGQGYRLVEKDEILKSVL